MGQTESLTVHADGLAKDKIDNIPATTVQHTSITVEQEHIDKELLCSVCLDDFILTELVRKLRCNHLYHAQCIIAWLERHGDCPLCRRPI